MINKSLSYPLFNTIDSCFIDFSKCLILAIAELILASSVSGFKTTTLSVYRLLYMSKISKLKNLVVSKLFTYIYRCTMHAGKNSMLQEPVCCFAVCNFLIFMTFVPQPKLSKCIGGWEARAHRHRITVNYNGLGAELRISVSFDRLQTIYKIIKVIKCNLNPKLLLIPNMI